MGHKSNVDMDKEQIEINTMERRQSSLSLSLLRCRDERLITPCGPVRSTRKSLDVRHMLVLDHHTVALLVVCLRNMQGTSLKKEEE